MRIFYVFSLAVMIACSGAAPAHATVDAAWRASIALPEPGSDADAQLRALDRFVIGMQLGERDAVRAALADSSWSRHLREWSRARWLRQDGARHEAAAAYEAAARQWPRTLEEPEVVLAVFDRERLGLALELEEFDRAAAIESAPLRAHDDPTWDALRADLLLRTGEAAAAAALFDASWSRAAGIARRDPAFGARALAHLALADSIAAGTAWIDFVAGLRRPERQRAALVTWDREPGLTRAVRVAPERKRILDWLVRLFRRDEARSLALRWLDDPSAADHAELFVFVAEQAYRLRDNDALFAWLARPWPETIDADQRAALEAYPWGVRRRGGHSEEIAQAFDAIADRYAPTSRAAEARWEAAWMWELSEREDLAVQRYEQYLLERPAGPFASAAALRSIFLRWRAGDFEGAVSAFRRNRGQLDDGLDGAAALWLAARSLEQTGQVEEVALLDAELVREHPASPMWREPLLTAAAPRSVEDRLQDIAQLQARAWDQLAEHLDLETLEPGDDEDLQTIDRLAELGLATEAEIRLGAWADARRSDTAAIARVCALAQRRSLPEMQGRYGWILERRLRDRGDEVRRAALIASMPTPFARAVLGLGQELDVAPELVWALMRRESFYDADVLSIAGAYGLLQLIPRTASEMAARIGIADPEPEELFVPALNLRLGTSYLAGLLREADGDRVRALASYNAGESNGLRWQQRRRPAEPPQIGILVISYSETRAYAYHVQRLWNLYADAYGSGHP